MANEAFRRQFCDAVDSAVRGALAAGVLDHAGMTGTVREAAVQRLFRLVAPPSISLAKGKIVDAFDHQSPEVDIVASCPDCLPPFMFDQNLGLFPLESCVYAFEVKSVLTATELQKSLGTARAVRYLKYVDPSNAIGIVPAIFAFSSDLAVGGKTEYQRLEECDPTLKSDPVIGALCVVGRGYWYRHPSKHWVFAEATSDHREVVDFLSGVSATMCDYLTARPNPRIGRYLIGRKGTAVEP